MTTNRVNTSVSPASVTAITDGLETINANLPFLIDLTPDERIGLPKMADKTEAFVHKVDRNPAEVDRASLFLGPFDNPNL